MHPSSYLCGFVRLIWMFLELVVSRDGRCRDLDGRRIPSFAHVEGSDGFMVGAISFLLYENSIIKSTWFRRDS